MAPAESGRKVGIAAALTIGTFCCTIGLARARLEGYQRTRPLVASRWVHAADVGRSLVEVLNAATGEDARGANDVRIGGLKEALRPMYAALPKDPHGRLGHAAVRYALHRHFAHKHAMYIKGLEPAGSAWNSSSPTDILEDQVPAYIQGLFEERLQDGFDLLELAVLAAALEHVIHKQALATLQAAYAYHGVPPHTHLNESAMERVIRTYMFLHVGGWNGSTPLPRDLESRYDSVPTWPQIEVFLRDVQDQTLERMHPGGPADNWVTPAAAMEVVRAVNERYGRFQDGDCQSMAKALSAKDTKGRGRIALSDFYSAGEQYSETAGYLRQLGALDESGPGEPAVIIPNYITSASNCLGTSSIYSICCIDHCEKLLGHVERQVAAPDATPERIVKIVSALPSATASAPRHLPLPLIRRLEEIERLHGGRVPIHGRLFAQWMHHAFPHECPFPQTTGTTKPMTADEWLKETGNAALHSRAALAEEVTHMKSNAKGRVDTNEDELPWVGEEELHFHHVRASPAHELWVVIRSLAIVAVFVAAALSLVDLTKAITGSTPAQIKRGLLRKRSWRHEV